MKRWLPILALLLSAQGVAEAQTRVVSDTVAATALTVYPDDLALVTETRRVQVPAGRSTIAFEGVSDLIIPQSLILQSFTGVSLERNFDYNLLGKVSLYENSIGETIGLTRIDRGSGEVLSQDAEIVAANAQGGVVVKTDEGYEGLFCSGLTVRESFEGLPPGLAARPVMSVEVEAEDAGEQEVVISYLTSGFDWEADYRLDLGDESNLLGWLSLENGTAKRYEDVQLAVIAGQLQRDRGTRGVAAVREVLRDMCWPVGSTKRGVPWSPRRVPDVSKTTDFLQFRQLAAAPVMESAMANDEVIVTGARVQMAQEEQFADYKLYRIPQTVTVGAYQAKQVAFVDTPGVDVERLYDLSLDQLRTGLFPLAVRYDIDNDREGELAKSLPEGVVRVFVPSASMGRAYVGEDRIEDTPVDQEAKITAGRSVDVFADIEGEPDDVYVVTLTNAGSDTAMVEMDTENFTRARVNGARRVEDEDVPTWRVEVPARERVEVRVRLR